MGMMSGQLRVGAASGSAGGDGPSVSLVLAFGGILVAGAALARTAPAEADRGPLGLSGGELLLAVTGIAVAVLAGLAFGGLI